MSHYSYDKKEYQDLQNRIMKENWREGLFDVIRKRENRLCKRKECRNFFEITPSNPKIYCSHRCSAIATNKGKIQSKETKLKIGRASVGRKSPFKGILKTPRINVVCNNIKCGKIFLAEQYRNRKYCSNACAMIITGGRPTSPKASKGKGGIRKDISGEIYFYSRWEANYARLLNYLKVKWEYAPKTFDLGTQNYTPDFYLPESNLYIEVKNFMWKYSKIRDDKFRKLYPNIKLQLLLKEDYLKLQNKYAKFIKNWEYMHSIFPSPLGNKNL